MGTAATVDAAREEEGGVPQAHVGAAPPQHLRALEHANRVRLARADLKRRIAARQLTAAQVLRERPWQADRMSISDLLMSQQRWGRARSRRLLLAMGVPENKPIGTLTDRQRNALVGWLERSPREA